MEDFKKNSLEAWERTKICSDIAALELQLKGMGYPAWMPGIDAVEHYISVRRYSDLHGMHTFNEIKKANPQKDLDEDENDRPRKPFTPTNYRDPYG
jgi:hypothetical protein